VDSWRFWVLRFKLCALVVSRYCGQLHIYAVTFGLRRCDCSIRQSDLLPSEMGTHVILLSVT
jgi:hypothetical protein